MYAIRSYYELSDFYDERLHSLETKITQTVDPYEARLTSVESRLEASADSETPQPPFT